MKQDLFIQRLKELADVKRVKVPRNATTREFDGANDIFRNGQTFIIDKDNNSTWAYEIKRLKPIIKDCSDCGKECKDRRVTKTLYTFPKRHWRKWCSGCNRVQNPDSGLFDLAPVQAAAYFVKWFKKEE